MLFNSVDFLLFFPIVSILYFIIPQKIKYIWLLVASYYFYMCWNVKYALLLLVSTAVTYVSGRMLTKIDELDLDGNKKVKIRKFFVAASLVINLSILFLFKYINFVIESINRISQKAGITLINSRFDLLLPVGISFYIFQALSYTLDVYRKEVEAEKNFLRYALFVSFFPQLVAGPIERSKNLIGQIREEHKFDYDRMRKGLLMMLWGYFLKLVVADRIGIFVDTVYKDVYSYSGACLLIASMLFAIQIYSDFHGYSMIARGAAYILGFRLMENFDCPYFAESVAEFWRRWHISLTSWFRDYLYIPLGGNRKGWLRKYINVMIVFLLSGLWHGAQWTYVFWGGLNGLFQVLGDIFKPIKNSVTNIMKISPQNIFCRVFKILITFLFVDFTWIFFRANYVQDAIYIIKSIFTTFQLRELMEGNLFQLGLSEKQFGIMLLSIVIVGIADYIKYQKKDFIQVLIRQKVWCRWIFCSFAVVFVLLFGIWGAGYDAQAFVYFQF